MHIYTVEFRIGGQKLIPSDVTAKLGLEPCQVREAVIREGGTNRKALWCYNGNSSGANLKCEWESLEEGLLYLLERLVPKQDLILSYCQDYDLCWWCGHFQKSFDGGPTFSTGLLRKLADFGVPLILDNYFSDEDDG